MNHILHFDFPAMRIYFTVRDRESDFKLTSDYKKGYKQMNKLSGFAGVLMLAAAMTACQGTSGAVRSGESRTGEGTVPATPKPEPVTLKIGFRPAAEADVDMMIAALKKMRPEITIEKLPPSNSITEMLARGDKPDLLQFAWTELVNLSQTGLALDMTPYLKTIQVDMNTFRTGLSTICAVCSSSRSN